MRRKRPGDAKFAGPFYYTHTVKLSNPLLKSYLSCNLPVTMLYIGYVHKDKSEFSSSTPRRYVKLYALCVFFESFIMYSIRRKEETEWTKSRLANS